MHPNSRLLFETYAKRLILPGTRLLEIGPDSFPSTYAKSVNDPTITWDTLDIYQSDQLTYPNSDEYSFPIPDQSYDTIVAAQVIEHVKKVWVWLREVERVCKSGGHVILINPVSWPYHPHPVDCWRIYPEGMKALLEDTSLKIIECRYESLEAPGHRRYLPGRSPEFQEFPVRLFFRLAGRVGFPIERAYDTITIAQKN
jgi:SAM-dependent methyltransferase